MSRQRRARREKLQQAALAPLPPPSPSWSSRYWPYVLLAIILLFAAIRIRLLNFPLERDEGEYAYAGQLILQGVPPYSLAYNMKLPGTYYFYSAILFFFGQTPAAVHLGLLLVNLTTIVLVFLLTKKLFGSQAGVFAAAAYALLSISPSVLGFAGHATHFVVLCAMAGLLLLEMATESKRLWLFLASGLFLGLAFLMKQPGALFLLFGGLYLIKTEWTRPIQWSKMFQRAIVFSVGALLPFALVCLVLYRSGVFPKFWFWTFSYAREYGAIQTLRDGWLEFSDTAPEVVLPAIGIWVLALVGLSAFLWNSKIRPRAVFVIGLLIFSFLAVSAGLYFRPHYFILMLPAVAILAGVAVSSSYDKLSQTSTPRVLRLLPAAVFVFAFALSMYTLRDFFFKEPLTDACRDVYGLDPFPEALPIADYIQKHSDARARIAVFGSEPEVYFYSHRHSATGYIYMYGLTERQKYASVMQKETISEVETAQPEFVVLCKGPLSYWGLHPESDMSFFTWGMQFLRQHYTLVGAVEVQETNSQFYWESDLQRYRPRPDSPMNVLVFRRNS
jgi:4-amino-4-deoxy-L-arabinose transferase-like glycosyltransferase